MRDRGVDEGEELLVRKGLGGGGPSIDMGRRGLAELLVRLDDAEILQRNAVGVGDTGDARKRNGDRRLVGEEDADTVVEFEFVTVGLADGFKLHGADDDDSFL